MRWWYDNGKQHQVKGSLTLSQFSNVPMFRIAYAGKYVLEGNMDEEGVDSHGVLYLPIDAGRIEITRSTLTSEHVQAQGVRLTLPYNCDGLTSIQLIIPAANQRSAAAARLFCDALEAAENERVQYFCLA